MIGTSTTFIIGAGASCPYGLPTGKGLRDRAIALEPNSPVYQLLLTCSIDAIPLNKFVEDLRQHPTESIDAYLETRQYEPETMRLGKHVIAGLLGDQLQAFNTKPEDDWLGYLFRKMQDGAGDGDSFVMGNRVNFITFNFDRIIEDRFKEYIQRTHPRSSHANFPSVLHVHGSLPPIPSEPLESREWYTRSRLTNPWRPWLQEAAQKINVVLDDIPENTLQTARRTLAQAQVVCFLGFQYASGNMRRLYEKGGLTRKSPLDLDKMEVFGSAYGLRPGEQEAVRKRFFDRIELGGEADGCLAVLRSKHVLRD